MRKALSGSEDPSHRDPGPGFGGESCAIPVGAALAATRLLQAAGSDTRRNREHARSHRTCSHAHCSMKVSYSSRPSFLSSAHSPSISVSSTDSA